MGVRYISDGGGKCSVKSFLRKTLLCFLHFADGTALPDDVDAGGQGIPVAAAMQTGGGVDFHAGGFVIGGCGDVACGVVVSVAQLVVHPEEALAEVAANVLHLGLIAAPEDGVLVYLLVHDGPSHEVQLLRLLEVCFQAVDDGEEVALVDVALPGFLPELPQPGFGGGVADDDVIDEGAHVACHAASGAVDVVVFAVDGVGAVVVFEGEVHVPYGAGVDGVVLPVLVHIGAPEGVGVAGELADEEEAQEGAEVEAPLPVGFHVVEVIYDVRQLPGLHLVVVGVVYGHGVAFFGAEPVGLGGGVGIDLHEEGGVQGVGGLLRVDGIVQLHAVLLHIHVVHELEVALVLAVEEHIHGLGVGCVGHSHAAAEFVGQQVAHEGLVAVVVDEHPFLRLGGRIQHAVFLVVLDAVGFLGEGVGAVAPAADDTGVGAQGFVLVADDGDQGVDVVLAVVGFHVVLGVDAHHGQVRQPVECGLVALAGVAVELHLSDVALLVRGSYVAHVAEAFGAGDVGVGHLAGCSGFGDDVQGQGVHEVGAVGSLEDSQHHPFAASGARCRAPPQSGDDVRLAQVHSHPGEAAVVGCEIRGEVAVEGARAGVHGRGCPVRGVVYGARGADDGSTEFAVCLCRCRADTQKECGNGEQNLRHGSGKDVSVFKKGGVPALTHPHACYGCWGIFIRRRVRYQLLDAGTSLRWWCHCFWTTR